tara:strand:- start:7293 stop:7475 length:183 start_codon:yes stop_codon:yes gene_type:complete
MFNSETPYDEIRISLEHQSLQNKQSFLESMIGRFLGIDHSAKNRLLEIEGAIDSILENER